MNLSQQVALRQLDCLQVALHRHRPVLSILVALLDHPYRQHFEFTLKYLKGNHLSISPIMNHFPEAWGRVSGINLPDLALLLMMLTAQERCLRCLRSYIFADLGPKGAHFISRSDWNISGWCEVQWRCRVSYR